MEHKKLSTYLYRAHIFYYPVPSQKCELEVIEMIRHRLTKREFKNIFASLACWAGTSRIFDDMEVEILRNGKKIMTITCRTASDDSTIRTALGARGRIIRNMVLAE